MDRLRAIIVDDEPVACRAIRLHLGRHPDIEVVAECANGAGALAAIDQHKPDLVFLDVQMPAMSGFEVLEAIGPDQAPFVIFVTAHDAHALRAFEVNAVDYLLKPFDEGRFDEAVSRARREVRDADQSAILDRLSALLEQVGSRNGNREPPAGYARRLLIRDRGRIFFLDTKEIEWIESTGNYACLHAGQKSYLLRTSMTDLEKRLDPTSFVRIHRATIVNLACIQEIRPYGGSDYRVLLTNGKRLNVSRGYSGRLLRDK